MRVFLRIFSSVQAIFYRSRAERDMDAELRSHIDSYAEDLVRTGLPRAEALRRARLEFGGLERVKEECRESRGISFVESLAQDLRFGLRMLRKSPGFTTVAVLTLALGIGANTAIFSATYSVLLKPLPYKDSSRLVNLGAIMPGDAVGAAPNELDSFAIEKIRTLTPIFDPVIAFRMEVYRWTGYGAPKMLLAGTVSGNYFSSLGVRAALGRIILPDDETLGHVVVLSYQFWQKQFGGDPKIIGKQLEFCDAESSSCTPTSFTVIGVAPPSFASPVFSSYGTQDCDAWVAPLSQLGGTGFLGGDMIALGRLRRGVTLQKANIALQSFSEVLGNEFPSAKGWTLHAEGLKDTIVGIGGKFQLVLLVLLGAVGFVLLIACANVTSLMLARAWGRTREIAVREALGATRPRVLRQLLTEAILLYVLGCGLGLLLAYWGLIILRASAPHGTPRAGEIGLYGPVLWYALVISVVAAVAFGLVPALQVTGRRLYTRLSAAGISSPHAGTERRHPFRHGLVIAEVALAVALLTGSGLLLRSFAKLTAVPLGLRTDHIVKMSVQLGPGACKQVQLCKSEFNQIVKRIRDLSGVQEAALTNYPPLEGYGISEGVSFEPPTAATAGQPGPTTKAVEVGPAYFRLFGIPFLRGREFTAADSQQGSPLVVIVNKTFADKFLSGDAIGKRLWYGLDKKKRNLWLYVVGEVKDTRDSTPFQAPQPELYHPFAQGNFVFPSATLLVRTGMNPAALLPAIRDQVGKFSDAAILDEVQTMNQLVSEAVAQPRFQTGLLSAFGALGLLLATVGIYGLISYNVTQRTHEIGVRMALGAGGADVLRMILGEGLVLALIGIVIGVAGALALTRFLRSLLFEIKPTDPATFIGVAILLALVALAACYFPARRAMKVDPMVALRYE